MMVMMLLGFSSGLPLPLTGGTLQAWLTVTGIDLKTIGIFSLIGLPYTIKFLWSPFMDRFVPPWLGRRRGWVFLTQVALLICIVLMALASPEKAPFMLAVVALTVAFMSASQDIVIDAYRTDVLPDVERGMGAAVFVFGYRIAMIVAGAVALILSEIVGWHTTYLIMASIMVIGMSGSFIGKEPHKKVAPPKSMQEAAWGPLKDFLSRKSSILMLLLIILYKLGDAYAGALTTTFLIRGVNFSPTDVGTINKGMGLVATIVGALFGGALMVRLGLFKSLLVFGFLQMVSNLSFMVLAWTGKNYAMLVVAVAFENLSGGMGTAAFVAFLMALCNPRFSATQFALLSSLSALGRVLVSPTSGYAVEMIGWAHFFLFSTFTALPGLWLVWYLRDEILAMQETNAADS
ncbi:MAG: MFS transporter [Syntrophorhabdaceae bacterium]|nr:MFS transporter [Syntrophorhabdaceae bacterium]MDD5243631.1 MFS transporter [Syntrophorhabdaceae bacterium]